MSYYADESDAYTDYYPDDQKPPMRVTPAHRDYLAAREAMSRSTTRTPQPELFAIQDRFYRAQVALLAEHDLALHLRPENQRILAEIRGAA